MLQTKHIFLIIFSLHTSLAVWDMEEEKNIMKAKFDGGGYDRTMRPSDNSTTVHVRMLVREFQDINDKNSDFTVKVTLRQRWKDPRLTFTSSRVKYITLPTADMVWRPDTLYRNEKIQSHDSLHPSSNSVRVYPNGDVRYINTATLTLRCPMNLRKYPFGYQKCRIPISSHGWTTEIIRFEWEHTQPVGVVALSRLPSFTVAAYSTNYCDIWTNQGAFSCVAVEFTFLRQPSYVITTVYIPMMMFLIVSMMSQWISMKNSGAVFIRIAITLTMLIMCSNRADQVNSRLPIVNYTKAIDVWTGMCVFFAFWGFAETVLATSITDDKDSEQKLLTKMGMVERLRNRTLGAKIDLVSRILLPTCFLFCVIGYIYKYNSPDVTCAPTLGENVTCLIEF